MLPRAGLIATIAIFALPLALLAHAHLRRSEPSADARLPTSPTAIRLWFSERPELSFTRIRLRGADSTDIPLGTTERLTDDPMGVTGAVSTALSAGTYRVLWRTAAAGRHATAGSFTFDVASTPATPASPAAAVRRAARA